MSYANKMNNICETFGEQQPVLLHTSSHVWLYLHWHQYKLHFDLIVQLFIQIFLLKDANVICFL